VVKKRIIPVILLRSGVIVQSKFFKRYQPLGTPTAVVERLSNWESDEIIYLDISPAQTYDLNRDDLNHPSFSTIEEIVELVAKKCQTPLTFGGGIREMSQVSTRIHKGADKITLNTVAIENRNFITEIANRFGSQSIVISIDVVKEEDGRYLVYKRGKERTLISPVEFARECESAGAGEILVNSVNRDGSKLGFDIELIQSVVDVVGIPVIALGGAGTWEHFEEVLVKTNVSGVAAANIFQYTENSMYHCKQYLYEKGLPVRKPGSLSGLKSNL
jgi:cyclase